METSTTLTNQQLEDDYLDILGNGAVLKKTLHPGQGRDSRAQHTDVVTISCQGRLDDGKAVDCHEEMTFVLGDGDVIQAFDLAISLAELQEEFELITDARFAYGDKGREPDIPPHARITYTIKILGVDDPTDYDTLSPDLIMAEADKKRERGNHLYRREEFAFSVNSYMKALKILDSALASAAKYTPEVNKDILQLKINVTNNLAAAQLKIEAFEAAIESCNYVLLHEPDNVKALFRKGKSVSGKGDQLEAMNLLKKALSLEPSSRLASAELTRVRALWSEECNQRARICKKMFSQMRPNGDGQSSSSAKQNWSRIMMIGGGFITALVSIGLAVMASNYNSTPTSAIPAVQTLVSP